LGSRIARKCPYKRRCGCDSSAPGALEKNGVRQFTPRGEKFDPNFHQAMFEVPNPSVPAGFVVEVVQPGYMIGERMLRPALVGVSKGGPKVAPIQGSSQKSSTVSPES